MPQEEQEADRGHAATHLADELGKPLQLYVQRGLYTRNLRRLTGYVAYLRLIAHGRHHVAAGAVHHHRRTQQHVLRISLPIIFIPLFAFLSSHSFRRQQLARQARLVHLQAGSLRQPSVGRHFVAGLHQHHVAYHHFAAGNQLYTTVSHHLYRLLLAHLCQHVELAGSVALKVESYRGGQEDGGKNAQGLDIVVLHHRQQQGDRCRHQEDAHHRVFVFLQIEAPHGLPLRRCQHVLAVLAPAGQHLVRRQTKFLRTHFACKGTIKRAKNQIYLGFSEREYFRQLSTVVKGTAFLLFLQNNLDICENLITFAPDLKESPDL